MLDANDVDVVLGRSTLSDTSQGAELGVQAVKLGTSFDGDYQGDGVPRFDAAYLVLSSPVGQTPIKIAGTDEGALWDAGQRRGDQRLGEHQRVREPGRHSPRRERERGPGLHLQR